MNEYGFKGTKSITFLIAITFLMAACGGKIPQAEKTYSGRLSFEERIALEKKGGLLSKIERNMLKKVAQNDLREAVSFKEFDVGTKSAVVDVGFIPNRNDAYAVYRDGTGVFIKANGEKIVLDKLSKRIDAVMLAGSNKRRVVGLSPRGTQVSWNTANLTQQLVLRPQQTTFSQVQVLDAASINRANQLVTAAGGGLLERWSLTSGHLIHSTKLKGIQPRQVAMDSSIGSLFFGTNDGDVRIWSGRQQTEFLYKHSGPILDIQWLPKRGLLISSAKDGSVQIYNIRKRQVIHEMKFSKVVYDITVSQDESRMLVTPSIGTARVVNFDTLKERKIQTAGTGDKTSGAIFLKNPRYLITKHGARAVAMWNTDKGSNIKVFTSGFSGGVRSISVAEAQDVLVISGDKSVKYWNLKNNAFIKTALISEVDIGNIGVSDNGKWIFVSLIDGRVLKFKIQKEWTLPIKVAVSK